MWTDIVLPPVCLPLPQEHFTPPSQTETPSPQFPPAPTHRPHPHRPPQEAMPPALPACLPIPSPSHPTPMYVFPFFHFGDRRMRHAGTFVLHACPTQHVVPRPQPQWRPACPPGWCDSCDLLPLARTFWTTQLGLLPQQTPSSPSLDCRDCPQPQPHPQLVPIPVLPPSTFLLPTRQDTFPLVPKPPSQTPFPPGLDVLPACLPACGLQYLTSPSVLDRGVPLPHAQHCGFLKEGGAGHFCPQPFSHMPPGHPRPPSGPWRRPPTPTFQTGTFPAWPQRMPRDSFNPLTCPNSLLVPWAVGQRPSHSTYLLDSIVFGSTPIPQPHAYYWWTVDGQDRRH